MEFKHGDGTPAADVVSALRAAALRRDLLLLSCGTDDNVLRLLPPLTIEEAELDAGLDILEAALEEVSR
jgi:4-aminobutyrate aminotransferase-like enzyme